MTSPTTNQTDDKKLEELADQLESQRAMHEATLDGLEARINANVAALESSDIDAKMTSADNEVAALASKMVREDALDMEMLDEELAAADVEEDALLEEDELSPEDMAGKLTSADTGIAE